MTMRERVEKAVKEELKGFKTVEQQPAAKVVSLGNASYTKMLGKTAS
ncbi:hypothetical protein ACFXJ5_36710 [Streptomyces sp. NPDC059373]